MWHMRGKTAAPFELSSQSWGVGSRPQLALVQGSFDMLTEMINDCLGNKAKILLIDVSETPVLNQHLELPNTTGLIDILKSQALVREAIQHTYHRRVSVITTGRMTAGMESLLHGPQMSQFMHNLQHSPFDYVFFYRSPGRRRMPTGSDERMLLRRVEDYQPRSRNGRWLDY